MYDTRDDPMSDVPLPADWYESHVMGAADPLWQWDVHSDRIVLSPEAANLLQGGAGNGYRGECGAFCDGLAEDRQESVRQLFGSLRRSSFDSAMEILQTVGEDIICCRAIVVERFSCGTPRLLVGALTRLDGRGWLHETGAEGRWVYDCAREEYTLDRNCARLLRLPDSVGLRLPRQTIRDMLGSDAARFFSSRFSWLLNARDHDGSFVERVLLHLPDGSRKNFLVSGTLVGHDDSGQPVYVTGNLVQRGGEEPQEALSSKSCEISLMALFGSGDGLWDWNMETNTIYYTPRYTAMLGYDRSTFGNTFESWRDKLHPDERPAILKRQMDIIMSPRYGDSYEHSFRMRKADGTYCWILSRARVLRRNAHGRATRLIGLHTDITTTQGERDRLAEMIEYDPLTDVHSLVYFHNELDRLDMQPDKVVSIISCDVNGLKLINDYLGHDTGNSMLQTAARLLRSSLRSTDCVARLGGDEFAVLLPQCNLRDAARVLEKIRAVFRHYNEHSGNVPVIMSFGLSGAEEAPSLREALADRRMLHEKHGSRLVSGHAIKAWIEKRKDCVVSLEESRYDG